jgi:hypothetical protein
MEKVTELKYVSEAYADRLARLADTICTPVRFGGVIATAQVIEFPKQLELPMPPEAA